MYVIIILIETKIIFFAVNQSCYNNYINLTQTVIDVLLILYDPDRSQ